MKKIKTSNRPEWVDNLVTKGEFVKFKDKMLTLFDRVMGELKAIREELIVLPGRVSEHSDQLENHEDRLSKIENTLKIS